MVGQRDDRQEQVGDDHELEAPPARVKQSRSCARTRRVKPEADVKSDVTHSRGRLVVTEALPADIVKLDASLASPRTANQLERTWAGSRRPRRLSNVGWMSCPGATFTAPDGIPCLGADGLREERAIRPVTAGANSPASSVDRKLLGTCRRGSHSARPVPAVALRDPHRSPDACRSAIGSPILPFIRSSDSWLGSLFGDSRWRLSRSTSARRRRDSGLNVWAVRSLHRLQRPPEQGYS